MTQREFYIYLGQRVETIPDDILRQEPSGRWYWCLFYAPRASSYAVVSYAGYSDTKEEAETQLATERRD